MSTAPVKRAASRSTRSTSSQTPAGSGIGESCGKEPLDTSIINWPEEPLGFLFSTRWIPEKPDHGVWYLNFNYQFTDRLRAGIDYRPRTGDLSVLANYLVMREDVDGWKPGLIVGASDNDFGFFHSYAYFASFAKSLFVVEGINVSAFAGAVYIADLDEVKETLGFQLRKEDWALMFQHNGIDQHVSISKNFGDQTIGFILHRLEEPGLFYTVRF